jgi:hypothetical protein
MDLTVHVSLPDPPRDQLGELGTVIENQNAGMMACHDTSSMSIAD